MEMVHLLLTAFMLAMHMGKSGCSELIPLLTVLSVVALSSTSLVVRRLRKLSVNIKSALSIHLACRPTGHLVSTNAVGDI